MAKTVLAAQLYTIREFMKNPADMAKSLKKIKERAKHELNHKGQIDIGVVTYKDHFERFKDFFKKAVGKGFFSKGDFNLHAIPVEETSKNRAYEHDPFRRLYHKFKLATIGRYKS